MEAAVAGGQWVMPRLQVIAARGAGSIPLSHLELTEYSLRYFDMMLNNKYATSWTYYNRTMSMNVT
jgi:hypothetical protein